MRSALMALLLSAVVAASGCATETGDIISIRDPNPGANQTPEQASAEPPSTEGAAHENQTRLSETPNDTEPAPCIDELCDESVATCPDGEVVSCRNICDPGTGKCTSCIPDCSGHLMLEEECVLECGECERLDEEACECVTILYCDGNHICEPGNMEWPSSPDCRGYGSCDDDDPCTQDTFDPNRQDCIHTDICCDDQDGCTVDLYNYTTGECSHHWACCGDGECQAGSVEDQETCPEDCMEGGDFPGDVAILSIDPEGEVVALEGYGIDLSGWSIEDASGTAYNFSLIIIDGILRLHSIGDPADNNMTDLYWGTKEGGERSAPIWNNDADTATLRNSSGDVVDTYSYPL